MIKQEDLSFLKNALTAIEQLQQVCNLYRQKYNISTPEGYRKINDFENGFNSRYENTQRNVNALIRYIEKSFAPTEEEMLQEKALKALQQEHANFNNWPIEAQNALLEAKLNELGKKKQKYTSSSNSYQREGLQSMDNPELNKPYAITDNLIGCKPYKFEFLGETYNATSWKKVCAEVCTILYKHNPNLLENYVASPANTAAQKYDTISQQSDFFEKSYELMDGFYICDRSHSIYYRNFTIKLMDIYHIPLDNLIIYLSKIAKY